MCTHLLDTEHEATPLIKPTSDLNISTSPDHLMKTAATTGHASSKEQVESRAMNFFKAFCIPGVVVVRCFG